METLAFIIYYGLFFWIQTYLYYYVLRYKILRKEVVESPWYTRLFNTPGVAKISIWLMKPSLIIIFHKGYSKPLKNIFIQVIFALIIPAYVFGLIPSLIMGMLIILYCNRAY